MKKLKVIQICGASSSLIIRDYEEDIFRGWYAQIGFQLKKHSPSLNVEC